MRERIDRIKFIPLNFKVSFGFVGAHILVITIVYVCLFVSVEVTYTGAPYGRWLYANLARLGKRENSRISLLCRIGPLFLLWFVIVFAQATS